MFGWDPTTTATVLLAVVATLAFVVNVILAWFTATAARAARAQTLLEQRQLDLLERQLDATAQSARPLLAVEIDGVGPHFVNGRVRHVHGTEPAYRITVWIRTRDSILNAFIERLAPAEHEAFFMAGRTLSQDFSEPGFAEMAEGGAVEGADLLVGVRFERGDKSIDTWGAKRINGAGKAELVG